MPKIIIHNATTGEITERNATKQEIEQMEIDKATVIAEQKAKEQLAAAKVALLEKLGITEEEAKLLLS